MIETISPVVHGGRNRRYYTAVALHTVGAALSSAALGGLLGAVGLLLGAPWGSVGLWLIAGVAGLYALRELGGIGVPLPDLDRQVPDWWRTFYSRNVAAFLYGLGLGVGFATYLSFGTLVAVATAAVVTGHPGQAALIMGSFGVARGISVLLASGDATTVLDLLEDRRLRRSAAGVNGFALIAIAALALL